MNTYIYGNKKWFFTTILFSVLASTEGVFSAWVINNFITIAIKGSYRNLLWNVFFSIFGMLVLLLINIILNKAKNELIQSCNENIKKKLFNYLLNNRLDKSSKAYASLMTNDLKQLETKGLVNELSIILNSLMFLFALGYGLFIDYATIIIFLIASFLPLFVSKMFSKKIANRSKNWSNKNSEYMGTVNDYVSGIDTIVNYKAQKAANQHFSKSSRALEQALKNMNITVGVSNYTTSSVANLSILSLAIGFGILRVLQGFLAVGQLIAIIQISNNLINPLLNIFNSINERKTTKQTSDLLKSIHDTSVNKSIKKLNFKSLCIKNGAISLQGKTILSNLNININMGDKVLILAPSGYGKSTLLKAIAGFLSFNNGEYIINGNLANSSLLRSSVALIKQKPFIFDDTILFNITMGNHYSKQQIKEAIRFAQLESMVQTKGLDYRVGKNGDNLSGGQLQRIEIARGILSNRSLILADEITSALDKETADKVSNYLLNSSKTLIEVSHKVSKTQLNKYNQVIRLNE
ncbi:ATP-binding cassette domain-containing protein [Apilactobacillus xinyiensis]|uniref:ATP-binding cassette domain-containing protein n=1 Tax=Apilactobacillus xinyiensis TaxID=2841032 RepID=UPI001C7CFCEC|nr:ABC transporter ATP-binding protein [Apilactobacillus xinyiensis]